MPGLQQQIDQPAIGTFDPGTSIGSPNFASRAIKDPIETLNQQPGKTVTPAPAESQQQAPKPCLQQGWCPSDRALA